MLRPMCENHPQYWKKPMDPQLEAPALPGHNVTSRARRSLLPFCGSTVAPEGGCAARTLGSNGCRADASRRDLGRQCEEVPARAMAQRNESTGDRRIPRWQVAGSRQQPATATYELESDHACGRHDLRGLTTLAQKLSQLEAMRSGCGVFMGQRSPGSRATSLSTAPSSATLFYLCCIGSTPRKPIRVKEGRRPPTRAGVSPGVSPTPAARSGPWLLVLRRAGVSASGLLRFAILRK